uniref:Uncharacterized protein n=1 Tax=Siphoviridae sp. ctwIa5 TaxID=2825729 RepID=A0A8S5PGI7_9CAUD|nr:MAG TPA: hypothetical protein [Siphoviridae sp. ctwIa5]
MSCSRDATSSRRTSASTIRLTWMMPSPTATSTVCSRSWGSCLHSRARFRASIRAHHGTSTPTCSPWPSTTSPSCATRTPGARAASPTP